MLWPTSVCWSVLLLVVVVASLCAASIASNQTSEDSLGDENATTIINGEAIPEGRFPFMAILVVNNAIKRQSVCGASIMSETLVLTSAQCVWSNDNHQLEASQLRVGAGSVHQFHMTWHDVQWVWSHPDFQYYYLENGNDIALVKLADPLTLQKGRVETIELASAGAPVPHSLSVLGWGMTRNEGKYQQQLRGVDVNTIDLQQCSRITGWRFSKTMFCDEGHHKGPCHGDAGAPLFNINTVKGRFVQHGIVSGGNIHHCGAKPNFYTKVSAFTDQIMKIISTA